ncbi:hypothetical protein F5144DRAFT_578892 [Chaetomium tenue]|uniref:Uncharacterized protein n=1 Tax=Chaetomium tenue TaxID=1854479 RepID=A0ACB7P2X4_9PEZI|nr:hypothetical protein F5144DRAFT_578892 [Chaetomium globosum]
MYQGGHRPASRDGGTSRDRNRDHHSRSRSPHARRSDNRDGGYRRSRKDSPDLPRYLNYDDSEAVDDYPGTAPGRHRLPRDRYYSKTDHDPHHYNDASVSRPRGLDDLHGHGLRPDVHDSRPPRYAPLDEAHRRNSFMGGPDSADYSNRDGRLPAGSRLGQHPNQAGAVDINPLRGSGGHRSAVPDVRGPIHHHDRRHLGRRQLGDSGRVILLNSLPEDATERDILYGLDYITRDRHFSSDKVRVARLRHNYDGSRFAFVEFHRRSEAEDFLDRYYPEITFRLQHSRGLDSEPITVEIMAAEDRDEGDSSRGSRRDDDGWDCINCGVMNYPHRAVCFKCKAERPEDDFGASGPFLTGETDECLQQTPSQYIVIRDLEGSVTEEVLAKGVMKLFVDDPKPAKETPTTVNKLKSTAPTNSTVGLGAKSGSLRRVFLMRDRKTNESWRYGFAEFATVEDAMAAVAKFRASTRFTIASSPVVVAFIHTGVFIPAFDTAVTENQEFSFTPIYNSAVRVKYWDERAYPSARVVSTDPLPGAPSPGQPGGNGDEATKSAAKAAKKAKGNKEPVPVAKVAMMPQVQLWTKASAQLHGAKPAVDAATPSAQEPEEVRSSVVRGPVREAEDAQPDGPVAPQTADQYLSYADWDALACLACGWEAPTQAHIDERGWPQAPADLLIEHEGRTHRFYQDDRVKKKAAAALSALGKEPRTIVRRTPRLKSEHLPVYKSYADWDRLRCLLCKRIFKNARLVWLHEQQSELHKRMLASPQNRARAAGEFETMGKKMRIVEPDADFKRLWEVQRVRFLQPQYRDRALERRRAFNQPKQPTAATTTTATSSSSTAATTASVPEKRKEPTENPDDGAAAGEPAAKKSKGAGMLAKMGWTAGAGLGAEGAGRTEAVATEVYAPGVGLGAEGGRLGDASEEAVRNTRGDFGAFVQKTRERARERFEKM